MIQLRSPASWYIDEKFVDIYLIVCYNWYK